LPAMLRVLKKPVRQTWEVFGEATTDHNLAKTRTESIAPPSPEKPPRPSFNALAMLDVVTTRHLRYNIMRTLLCGGVEVNMGTETDQQVNGLTREQFQRHLRDCLTHFLDPGHLRRSPLATLLGVANRFDTPSALQRILAEAIEALEPDANEPPQSRAWRYYESLYYRYIEQLGQQEVADQLGLSPRQVRREQRAALEVLAYGLWKQFDLEAHLLENADRQASALSSEAKPAVNEALAWLQNAPVEHPTDPTITLPATVDVVRPLAAQRQMDLEVTTPHNLPSLAIDPVAFRQLFLNVLTVAIRQAPSGGEVRISAEALQWEVEIHVECQKARSGPQPVSKDDEASLDMARKLAGICGVKLTLSDAKDTFVAALALPALEQLPVLAIDDTPGTLHLLQRYATGTRYRLIGIRDPEQALAMVEKISPQLIVLDVMMPHVDGWEILGRLRQHPVTGHIPIIVCTILAQEELALSLGASGFIRKPITREVLLAALDRQIELMATESR